MREAAPPLDLEAKVVEHPADHKMELRLWLRLLTLSNLIEGGIRRRLRETFDITLPRFDLMAQLDRAQDGMSLGELSRRMMVTNGNVTAIVDALVAQGLVDRQHAPEDRRTMIVRLTPEGRANFRAMAAEHEIWIAEVFSDLNPFEIDRLMALLGKAKGSAIVALGDP